LNSPLPAPFKITGLILAGGRGRRMGGVDKGLKLLRGRPMVDWVRERLAPQVDELLIKANQNLDAYRKFGVPVVEDRIDGYAGPLAGLQRGLEAATHPCVVTAPCDSPFLPHDLVARLYSGLTAAQAQLAVARTGDQPHPVFCLCQRTLEPHLKAFLDTGGRKIDAWYADLKVVEVQFDDEAEAFSNINTPQELLEFEQREP
jgi:molybdopterin-guanine dinucleotide biosynthesis protein A